VRNKLSLRAALSLGGRLPEAHAADTYQHEVLSSIPS
jgi:hypothetical protein